MRAELERILDEIPHRDLAVQWDVASEFAVLDGGGYDFALTGGFEGWFDDEWASLSHRVAELVDLVPEAVEVGLHLCYGDAGEAHFTEPVDASTLVRFAKAVTARTARTLTWLHMPVPIDRDDPAYFAPLASLALPEDTELYLGLVHRQDGAGGAKRRAAVAAQVVPSFGVATECGLGRAPAGTAASILRTHAAVSSAW